MPDPKVDVKPAPQPVSPAIPTGGVAPSTPNAPATPAAAAPVPGVDGKAVPLAALHEERERRQALQSQNEALNERIRALEAAVLRPAQQPQYGYQQPQYQQPQVPVQQQYQQPLPPQYDPRQFDQMWDQDPRNAVRAELATTRQAVQAELLEALRWYDTMSNQMLAQEDVLAQKYPDFNNYRHEVRQYVQNVPLAQRTNPGLVEVAYNIVRGQKVDSIIAQREQEFMQRLGAGAGAGFPAGGAGAPPAGGAITLSAEQVAVAQAMGLTPEEYAQYMPRAGGV